MIEQIPPSTVSSTGSINGHTTGYTHTYTPGRGLPLALPTGSSGVRPLSQVSATSGGLRGTNTPSEPSPFSPGQAGALTSDLATDHTPDGADDHGAYGRHRRRRRVDADVLLRLAETMPERDREVIERIGEHRYLTTHQIQQFAFTNLGSDASAARTTRYVLQRLERSALIRSLGRRIGGVRAGSSARIWQLAPAGARLLRDDGTTFRTHEPSQRFLAHCLAVADVHLGLRSLIHLPTTRSVDVQTEPDCWRRYTGTGGEARWLQPDLAARVSSHDYDDRWFIEVDLGTESLPTLLRKCGQYETYRATGLEQTRHHAFPLVLWIFTNPSRAEQLAARVLRTPRLTPQLYRFATLTDPDSIRRVLREPLS